MVAALFGVICIAGAAAYVTTKTSTVPVENFIVKDTDGFMYINNSKEYKEATKEMNKDILEKFIKLNEKLGVENKDDQKEIEKLNRLSNAMGKVMIVHTEQNLKIVKDSSLMELFIAAEVTDELKKRFLKN